MVPHTPASCMELDRSITRIMTTSRREACPCAATVDPVWPRSRMNVSGTVTLACMVTVRVLYAVCATIVVSDRLVVLQYPVGKLALKKDWAVAVALEEMMRIAEMDEGIRKVIRQN